MQFKLLSEPIELAKTDLVCVLCSQGSSKEAVLQRDDGGLTLDKAMGGTLSSIIKKEEFKADVGSTKLVYTMGKIPARAVLLIGAGESKSFSLSTVHKIAAKAAHVAGDIKAAGLTWVLVPKAINRIGPAERLGAAVQGTIFGAYRFDRYKGKEERKPHSLKEVHIIVKGTRFEKALEIGAAIGEATNYARDLVNIPAIDLTPEKLAGEAEEIAKKQGLYFKRYDMDELIKMGMNLLVAVGKASDRKPLLVHMRYRPSKKPKAKIALVGKGITFDSGGIVLKPRQHIEDMKTDMAGAASVIATMRLLGELKPAVEINAYIPIAENVIDARAGLPGDIVKARNGKTVEIVDTDAEGRLILADALTYAAEGKPDVIIDIATLTGGVLYALGEIYSAVLGNDQRTVNKLLKAAAGAAEPAWQLPLVKDYKKGLTDGPADLKNTGKTKASTILGALFLEEFVGETKWCHIDIAASARAPEGANNSLSGATGVGVRTLANFVLNY